MGEVKISVIIPVYNVEPWLEECLDSVISQTFNDIEIICVNDASVDGSQTILDRYAAKDSRIKVIINEKNEGLMSVRKRGYEAAAGDYLFFCDSDDFLPCNVLERLYNGALSSGSDIVAGDLALWRKDGKKAIRGRGNIGKRWDSFLSAILDGTTCSLCGALFHKSLFKNVLYETFMRCNYSEDRILLTQILLKKHPSVLSVGDVTYYYRINYSSLTRVNLSISALQAQLKALFWCYDYVNANNPGGDFVRKNDRFIMRYLSYYIECGYSAEEIKGFNAHTLRMMEGKELMRVLGCRLGVHTYLCIKSELYRRLTHSSRRVIRKLQGKD